MSQPTWWLGGLSPKTPPPCSGEQMAKGIHFVEADMHCTIGQHRRHMSWLGGLSPNTAEQHKSDKRLHNDQIEPQASEVHIAAVCVLLANAVYRGIAAATPNFASVPIHTLHCTTKLLTLPLAGAVIPTLQAAHPPALFL
jgi:hypothetical protein